MDIYGYDWTATRSADDVDTYDTPDGQVQLPMPSSPFNQEFDKALKASKEEFEKMAKQQRKEDKIQETAMVLSLSNEFSPLLIPGADTLIYIGPPPRAKGQSWPDYQYIQQRFNALHRVKSQTLRALASSAFDKLLGPKSERTRRRFHKEGMLTGVALDNIKYYIDLRPPEDGDEAVEQLTDLTCTQGILNWHKAQAKYSISKTLISGRDDFFSLQDQLKMADVEKGHSSDEEQSASSPSKPEAEYSALRHRSAIERVLQAIAHNDPKLDSAPKMWTYFQVARHLDVAKHERINGWITKWIYALPNSNFIQCNPEVMYRIGMGTMSTNILRDGFSMLAGEKVLLDTSDPSVRTHLQTSVHGRPLEILDDDERNRIDHAASSLSARMKLKFEYLVDDNMDWLKQSSSFSELRETSPKNDKERHTLKRAQQVIKDYIRGRILWAMARDYTSDHPELDQGMDKSSEFLPWLPQSFHQVYGSLTEEQRLLTRTMWIALHKEKLDNGYTNIWTPAKSESGAMHLIPRFSETSDHIPLRQLLIDREKHEPGTGILEISYTELKNAINQVSEIRNVHWVQDSATHNVLQEKFADKYFDVLAPQAESSAGGKHNLIELDDDQPLEMISYTRARSGSDKRQRVMDEPSVFEEDNGYVAGVDTDEYMNVTIPLRMRRPSPENDEAANSSSNYPTRGESQVEEPPVFTRTTMLDNRHQEPTQPEPMMFTLEEPAISPKPVTAHDQDRVARSLETRKLAFDIEARMRAESTKSSSWISLTGDVYVRVEPAYILSVNSNLIDTEKIWFVKPQPFTPSETTRNYVNGGRRYWRATTGQLYCKYPDGRVNLVCENPKQDPPTLAEAAVRITDPTQLKIYEIAYDAYARDLAEHLSQPYFVTLKGDMYLRNPPSHMDADSNVWNNATLIFENTRNKQSDIENGVKVEYWRSPSSHLFRRYNGMIALFTEGRDEPAPLNAADIFAAPLQYASSTGTHVSYDPRAHVKTFDSQAYWSPPERNLGAAHRNTPQALPADAPLHGYISARGMLIQFSDILSRYCEDVLYPPHIYHGADPIPRDLMDTLMCLSDDEWKYLPLWAGGNDDGTGGVFDEIDVPNLEAGGFRGGKRGLGSTVDGAVDSSDGFTDVASEAVSTVGRASKRATDGRETVKSFDTASSASGFMRQDELWEQIRGMKEAVDRPLAATEGDAVTVMGTTSDVQGQMFGDVDSDGDEGMDGKEESDEDIEFVGDDDLV